MDEKQAAALREPFTPELIEKRPGSGNMMLEFVGHATTTDRLLQVDPDWSWHPMGLTPEGLPAFDDKGGLWIILTVCGVSRPGYGDAGTKQGPNAVKEAIGDALRNAAMRFGVALDLWAKADLHAAESPRPGTTPAPVEPSPRVPGVVAQGGDEHTLSTNDLKEPPSARWIITEKQRAKLFALAGPDGYGMTGDQLRDCVEKVTGSRSVSELQRRHFDAVLQEVDLCGRGISA